MTPLIHPSDRATFDAFVKRSQTSPHMSRQTFTFSPRNEGHPVWTADVSVARIEKKRVLGHRYSFSFVFKTSLK